MLKIKDKTGKVIATLRDEDSAPELKDEDSVPELKVVKSEGPAETGGESGTIGELSVEKGEKDGTK